MEPEAAAEGNRGDGPVPPPIPFAEDWEYELHFPRDPRAPAIARTTLRAVLRAHGLDELTDRAELLASELATNSVRYTKGPASVRLRWAHPVLRVGVSDPGPVFPLALPGPPAWDGERGRGTSARIRPRGLSPPLPESPGRRLTGTRTRTPPGMTSEVIAGRGCGGTGSGGASDPTGSRETTTMTAYALAHLRPATMNAEILHYMEEIQATLDPFEGRFLVHGVQAEVLEGPFPGSVVVIAFPDAERARAWYTGDAYQAILPLRTRHIPGEVILVDGVPPGYDVRRTAAALRAAAGL
ncbi:DUF1330 domain-containing protein [Streptomyces sp. NPDC051567]|uniref:DUF1330 domain-containing protein n=1 Tax=Streptomyces sp. NPDC051567 TaxID=3365660 RepID=UPI0037918814